MSWCQVKTAYLLDTDKKFDNLVDAIVDETISDYNWDELLPDGWEFKGTDISGAAGFLLLFEIDHAFSNMELGMVEAVIEVMEQH